MALLAHPFPRPRKSLPAATLPTTFLDLVPFLCAGGLALIFTALLVEDDPTDGEVLGEQHLQLGSYQWRFIGLLEKEREWPRVHTRAIMALLRFRETSRVPLPHRSLLASLASTSAGVSK
jgi:hypothetical protein